MIIYVAGHQGMVGSAICRLLSKRDDVTLVTRSSRELDLRNQSEVERFFTEKCPDAVVLAAAKVGGIYANRTYPAQFIYENLMIQANVIHQAHKAGVKKLLQLGSSCIYPRAAPQPMSEEMLLTGELEPTNEPYAISKIAGIKLCESYNRQYGRDYRSVMPTNLYGPGDNFNIENSHVLPALIRRFHEAKVNGLEKVAIWGSGNPRREFLHVDDMAAASIFILELPREKYDKETMPMLSHINVGSGTDIKIIELARLIADVVEYNGEIITDPSKPDGTQQKLLNITRIESLGWKPKITLKKGVFETYRWFLNNVGNYRC